MGSAGTNEVAEWRYLLSLTINQQTENPVSCLKFDPYEELIWCGSSTGKVTSFSGTNHFNRYSAFVSNNMGAVNALDVTEDVVFSLSDNCLRGTSRQGVPVTKYTSPSLTKVNAICRMPTTSTYIIGGNQQKLLQYDFTTEKELRTAEIAENGATIIRYNGTSIFSADLTGFINIRNAKTFEIVQRIPCHGDRISDFDVQGSKMITCGYSQRILSSHGDPFVKVFDLRMYKAMAPIPMPFTPKFTRFMPSFYERIVVSSHSGGVRIADLNSNNVGTSLIIESNGISAFDFSSSKNLIAFGDFTGSINLYGDRDDPLINENSYETVFAFPPIGPPVSFSIDDMMTPLAAVPMPFPEDDTLLSDWPSELTQPTYRKNLPSVEHSEKKVMHYLTQVKNPRINTKLKYHNVVPYVLEAEVPKIEFSTKSITAKVKVPKMYRKCPQTVLVSSRRGAVEEVRDDVWYNTTKHTPIESTYLMNVLINPIIQAFYHIVPIRNILYSHICAEEICVSCQLRFLFAMMTDRKTSAIVSTDLVRSLIANGFGSFQKDVIRSTREMITMILKATSNVADYLDGSLEENILCEAEKTCLKTQYNLILRCVRCGAIQTSASCLENWITLNYNSVGSQPTFCQLIEKALHLGNNGSLNDDRECEECKAKSRMESKRRVKSLGSILIVDTNPTNEIFPEFWQRQLIAKESRPEREIIDDNESPRENKMCRFGDECRNKKICKFSHGKIDWEAENRKLIDEGELDGWSHYLPKRITAQLNDGIVRLSDVSDVSASDVEEIDESKDEVFELISMVVAIGNGEFPVKWTHTVTMVKDGNEEILPWALINEKLLCRVHEHEALHMDARWKLPLLLFYKKKSFNYVEEKRIPIPESFFFLDENLASNKMTSSGQIETVKLPEKGDLVGIDAEFIKIKCGKLDNEKRPVISRAVGRVSCVDATGTQVIFDDHVQVINFEDVADYLTQFSGIVSEDLDASRSSKYLTTLKRVYLKILILVQRGCIFVGHALNNDFTVLNIYVPKEQVIDTVHLLRLDSQRLLSLQFLAFQLLGDKIQEESHDSVVDARYALKIYRKYLELKEKDQLGIEMRRIYDVLPCGSPMKSVSPANSMTETK